jgi:hypothetical protein
MPGCDQPVGWSYACGSMRTWFAEPATSMRSFAASGSVQALEALLHVAPVARFPRPLVRRKPPGIHRESQATGNRGVVGPAVDRVI